MYDDEIILKIAKKTERSEVGVKEEIKKICHTVEIPVVAIGGIKKENIKTLEGTDVDGVAVVSAIFAAKDIKKDTKQLRSLVEEMKQK